MSPLILGAGPAGCAAAIALGREGARPVLLDRAAEPGDALCGGFLSWQTIAALREMEVDCEELGAHRVERLRLFAHGRHAETPLPAPACGLSRKTLDTRLRQVALASGARLEVDRIRSIVGSGAIGERGEWRGDALFLASGKHDIRGTARPREAADPCLGLRLRLPRTDERVAMVGHAIELHLFAGGYAGLVLQEDGSANVCMALRKSALAAMGGTPEALLESLAANHAALGARLGDDWRKARCETIGAVPYGWIAQETSPCLFRLGDQAAVIPSLAGEGIAIAIASGQAAARAWLEGGAEAAPEFQRIFARAAGRPLRVARLARTLAESDAGSGLALALTRYAPTVLTALMATTRFPRARSLARARRAA